MSEAGLAAGVAVGVAGAVGGGAVGACACIVSANKVSRQTDDKFLKTMADCSERTMAEIVSRVKQIATRNLRFAKWSCQDYLPFGSGPTRHSLRHSRLPESMAGMMNRPYSKIALGMFAAALGLTLSSNTIPQAGDHPPHHKRR